MSRPPTKPPRPAKVSSYSQVKRSASAVGTKAKSRTMESRRQLTRDQKQALAQKSANKSVSKKTTSKNSKTSSRVSSRAERYSTSSKSGASVSAQSPATRKKVNRQTSNRQLSKKNSVKRTSSKSTLKRKIPRKNSVGQKIGNFLLVVLIGAALLYLIYEMIMNFFLPNHFALSENTNLLLVEETTQAQPLYFLHFSPESKRTNLVEINPQTQVNLVGGYDNYEIRAVYPLLTLEKKDQQFLTAAYSFALSEVVDRVVTFNRQPATDETDGYQLIGEVRHKKQVQKLLWQEIWRLHEETGEWDRQLLEIYFFMNTGVAWRSSHLEDESWTDFHQQNFSKSRARDCSVAVVNSTSTSGLANRIATVLEKNGYLVTRTGNYAAETTRTTIYYNDESQTCMELVSRSIKVFPLEPIVVENKDLPQQHRAGVVVVAGEDLIKTTVEDEAD